MCIEVPDLSLRCFVARLLLSLIYALSSVKFPGLKLWLCKKFDKYEAMTDQQQWQTSNVIVRAGAAVGDERRCQCERSSVSVSVSVSEDTRCVEGGTSQAVDWSCSNTALLVESPLWPVLDQNWSSSITAMRVQSQ